VNYVVPINIKKNMANIMRFFHHEKRKLVTKEVSIGEGTMKVGDEKFTLVAVVATMATLMVVVQAMTLSSDGVTLGFCSLRGKTRAN
jgi:hypothetical protein